MIVKNEAAIIRDTLENIIAHIPLDYYVISDTGSDDNTAEIIEQFFEALTDSLFLISLLISAAIF